MTNRKKIAILFLAHAGVTQADYWEAWKNKSKNHKNDVKFFVHSDKTSDFETKYKLSFYDPDTKWGQKSLVLVYQRCVQEILEDYPNITMIFLVSGFDIPVKPVDFLFTSFWLEKSKIGRIKHGFDLDECKQLHKFPDVDSLEFDFKKLQKHVQWLALNNDHANIISDFDFSVFDPIDKCMQHTKNIEFREDSHGVFKENLFAVADEYYILSALLIKKVKLCHIEDITMTEFQSGILDDPSPIEWQSSTDLYNVDYSGTRGVKQRNLKQVLKPCINNSTTLFFRKIGPQITNLMEIVPL